jgi:transposase-like protein
VLPSEFKPSPVSLTPEEKARATLQYIQRAVEVIEDHLDESGTLPPWVNTKIHEAGQRLGMSVSAVQQIQQRRKK